MIDLDYIRSFFPPAIAKESRFDRYMLKEYLQLMILDHLASTPYINKVAFIGGTNLRLIQGIDRFSEDLDFDCKHLTEEEFMAMTDSVVEFLRQNNIDVETRDKPNPKLTAFRRNLYFPQMLFDLKLSGHKEERLLMKVEAQDQGVDYGFVVANVGKGRDFYDVIFLLSKTKPNMEFLKQRSGIESVAELKASVLDRLRDVDLNQKKRDFVHLLFNEANADRILSFASIVSTI